MDEDDFRDRPRQRKEPRTERPAWEKTLLEQLRLYVLREPEDFIIRSVVALELNLVSVEITVGQCLAALEREGLLIYKAVDPKEYPEVYLSAGSSSRKITWHEGQWIWGEYLIFQHKGFGNYKRGGHRWGIQRDRRTLRSKRAITKAQRKNPPVPVKTEEWSGKAHFIIRGQEFQEACREAGIPSDPKSDWNCPQCKKKNRYSEIGCTNYSHCSYRRPHERYWPLPPVQSVVCKRCGMTLEPGKSSHADRICNEAVVRGIMDS